MKIGRFSFDRLKKKSKDPLSGYYNYKNDDWTSMYNNSSYWKQKKPPTNRGWKTFYRVVAALGILAVLLVLKESNNTFSQQAREGLKVALTTEWDVTPVLDKAVALGLKTVNMDWPMFNEISNPVMPAMGEVTLEGSWAIPVSGQVVQEFGWGKSSQDNMERFNPGIDISATAGAPVKAVHDGKVTKIGHDRTYGEFVLVEHSKGEYALYAGLTEIAVMEGHQIQAGEVIGKVAEPTEGDAVLHFEVRENEKLIDPLKKINLNTTVPDEKPATSSESQKQDQESNKQ